ncbi:MAG: hypothetical protein LBH93_04650 [Chitinispirillales bacterium]|jgi:hypothetical protein|nr:hypothetical protein [Chitinispirillales bacterium]
MGLLSELFDPIPLAALGIAVFAIALILVFSRYFRLPGDFGIKEDIRDEIRLRLFNENEAFAEKQRKEKEEAEKEEAERAAAAADKEAAAAGGAAAAGEASGEAKAG